MFWGRWLWPGASCQGVELAVLLVVRNSGGGGAACAQVKHLHCDLFFSLCLLQQEFSLGLRVTSNCQSASKTRRSRVSFMPALEFQTSS